MDRLVSDSLPLKGRVGVGIDSIQSPMTVMAVRAPLIPTPALPLNGREGSAFPLCGGKE
jgi:hypothetical protein